MEDLVLINGIYFRKIDSIKQTKYHPNELERMIKVLTNEDFEDYEGDKLERHVVNPDVFELVGEYEGDYKDSSDNYTCICTENSCTHLCIINYIPKNIKFAVGSICYQRFDISKRAEHYHIFKREKCKDCIIPLVFKTCKYDKNTNKKCNNRCFDCIDKQQQELDKLKNELEKERREWSEKLEKEREEFEEEKEEFEEEREEFEKERRKWSEKFERVYLDVSYSMKDVAKALGAKWDKDLGRWYAPENTTKYKDLIIRFT